ncbi:heparan N-sulfatase [Pedobacter frigidisoli]|uniref:Heparan N-sulfatase n=1 Tax=Pedobacter frigidisoli TaxID=2530455 RepID=A0A4R0NVQ8_9SPHI|nr:sulfatase [Pedobacter frigidisoli]TCD05593.1 heparan N-sulfatase [Pedobacter frigidisoli]
MKTTSTFIPLLLGISVLSFPNFKNSSKAGESKILTVIADTRPNIVIFMADDLDSRQLSCYGGQNLQTKNIDALAAEGMKFDQMICSETMCVPTRASLFTGLYPMHHGSFQNHKPVYNTGIKSVCQYLNQQNYSVALTGKNHSTKPQSVFPFEIIKGFEPNCVSVTDDYELDDIKKFVTRKAANPFCLFVMSINPHAPWTVGDASEFDPDKVVLPPHMVDTKAIRVIYCKYLAEIRRLDDQVGDVRKMLKETGQEQNTIFIFLGEQGPQFPGGKWTLWDNGQKSSMIVKWPGKVRANSKSSALVQYEDITPTLINIAGGKPIQGLDGKSFLPVLNGQTPTHRATAFGIHNNIPEGTPYPMRSIRDNHFKLIMNLRPNLPYYIKYMMNPANKASYWNDWVLKAKTSPETKLLIDRITTHPALEFYDLQKDPYEMHNLLEDKNYQKLIGEYQIKLKNWMRDQGDEGATVDRVYGK